MINRGTHIAALLALFMQGPCFADDTLQGRVEQRNANTRLNRPAMPSRPLGDALEHVPSGSGTRHKSGFDLAASSVSNLLDKHSFDFNYRPESGKGDIPDRGNKALKTGVDASDKELVVAWEEWHKRLCSSIYHYWLTYGNIPGDGVVVLYVTKDGDVDFELQDFHVNPFEQFTPQQRELFDQSVARTLQMLAHTDILTFPARSQRRDVTLSTKFSFTEQDDGPQGYTWKKGDYERVTDRVTDPR